MSLLLNSFSLIFLSLAAYRTVPNGAGVRNHIYTTAPYLIAFALELPATIGAFLPTPSVKITHTL